MMPQASRVRVRVAYAAHGTRSAAARASRPVPSFLCSNPLQAAVSSNSKLRGATEVLKYLQQKTFVECSVEAGRSRQRGWSARFAWSRVVALKGKSPRYL